MFTQNDQDDATGYLGLQTLLRGRDLGFVHWIVASFYIARAALATGFPTAPKMIMSRPVFLAMIVTAGDVMDCMKNIYVRYAAHVEKSRNKLMVTQNAGTEPPALHRQDRTQIITRMRDALKTMM